MKLFIAGAGEVGTHLAKLLSADNHDIILMDSDPERIEFAYDNSFELMPYVGDPTSIEDLRRAGAGRADLFVSVTPEESMNMIACMLADTLGAKKTVARINNNEYLLPANSEFFAHRGVDVMIYPERLAAQEIVSGIKLPWTRQYWSLFNDQLNLVAVKMRDNAPLCGNQLKELSELEEKYFHIVAIKRKQKTIIPAGSDSILSGDLVFFTCKPEHLDEVRKYCGKESVEVNKVIIMGGGRIAVRTAEYLPSDIRVKIIEQDLDKCRKLSEIVKDNVLVIHGDARDPELLKDEGIASTEAFLALTNNAESNMLAALTAKKFGVFRTVAEIENIAYLEMAEEMEIGNLINKKLIAAGTIFRHLLNIDVNNVKCLTVGKADVFEIVARKGSKVTKKLVKDLKLPKGITFGGLLRQRDARLITGDEQIQEGDVVMVFSCNESSVDRVMDFFE